MKTSISSLSLDVSRKDQLSFYFIKLICHSDSIVDSLSENQEVLGHKTKS